MIILQRRFKPSLPMSLVALIGIAVFVMLGLWQLDRAALKETIIDKYEGRLNADYQELQLGSEWQQLEYQRAILRGHYLNDRTLLVDNRIYQGKPGYDVLTAFELSSGELVLVNRGWVEAGQSRQTLPVIDLPIETKGIKGIVTIPNTEGFRMGEIALTDQWPQLIPYVDLAALQKDFNNRLLPIVIWLASEQPGHFVKDWQPVWMLPEKSQAYAVQWFAFALVAFILFIVLNLRKLDDERN